MRTLLAAVLLLFTLPSLADSYADLYQAGGWPQQRAHFRDALNGAQLRYRNSLPPAIYQALLDNSNQRFNAAAMDQRALAGLRQGGASLRGSFMTTEEIADNAFKACDGHLRLADGKEYRITMVGYTPGSATGYFELKI